MSEYSWWPDASRVYRSRSHLHRRVEVEAVACLFFFISLLILHPSFFLLRAASAPPAAADSTIEITLFAEDPGIVTPTGVAVDKKGRVFAIENNTHFRPDDYDGPKADRILLFEDTDGDGKADGHTVFYEGLVWGTDLTFSDDGGWLYASTRSEIYRMRDTDDDGRADEVEGVIRLETEADYPHNGISGVCFDENGVLHFGLGENYGADYTMIGTDPEGPRPSGGGEGGSIYRCNADGSGLERIATGVWNPFGMGFDSAGNLFATDNDPSSSPPCRLLHVVEGADFGYEYRYGRSGRHPLVTWNGEIPGTVPMVCGTGEAPCGIMAFGPGRLLVASWADHRVDLYELSPRGASFSAERSAFLAGDNDFRPVDIAAASDGVTFYITDWVSGSYTLHGRGRIWRLRLPKPLPAGDGRRHPELIRAGSIQVMKEPGHFPGLLQLLDEPDPYIRSAAILAIQKMGAAMLQNLPADLMETPRQRAGVLVALKRSRIPEASETLAVFLQDPDEEVRFSAVKWIADDQLTEYRAALEEELKRPDISLRMFLATMAAIGRLNGEKPRDIPAPQKLLEVTADAGASPALRAMALRMIPSDYKKLSLDQLAAFLESEYLPLRLEAIRSLKSYPGENRGDLLAAVARDDGQSAIHRAEAIAGLALLAERFADLLAEFADGDNPAFSDEALRALVGVPDVATKKSRKIKPKPPPAELDAWEKILGDGEGDPEAGRRIFFHPKIGTCSRCHRMEGRGIRVGPDLTTIWKHAEDDASGTAALSGEKASAKTEASRGGRGALRRWLLESLLQPGAAVAPQFLPWQVTLKDGSTRVGLPLRKGSTKESYLGVDGAEFSIPKTEIARHDELQASLMPAGLLEQMTAQEIRDLLAYLTAPK